jgi:hypothetical protein
VCIINKLQNARCNDKDIKIVFGVCLRIRNMDPRKNEERVINAFEMWCWRGMLKII